MTARVDVEEIEATRGEKLLALVLCAFLLTGALWVYFNIDREDVHRARTVEISASERAAIGRRAEAARAVRSAKDSESARRRSHVEAREAYRTALEEGGNAAALGARYRDAQEALATARRRLGSARRSLARAEPPARDALQRLSAAKSRDADRLAELRQDDRRWSFVVRLVFVLLSLGAAFALLSRLRNRRSRWLLAGMAPVGAAALLVVVMAVDYLTDYIEVNRTGVLVLSVAGAVMTVAAFNALQRYLARRLPERRVRRHECPFCGFPAGDGPHCEGCGREVMADCAACGAPRRVGARHCEACGSP